MRALQGSRAARLGFWAAALFGLVMALMPRPPRLPGDPSDKVQHIIAFAVLGALAALAWPRTSAVKLIVALSAFGAFIEIAQAIPILHRDSDIVDWIADTVACGVVLLAFWLWRAKR